MRLLTLKLHFILDNEGLALVVDGLGEFGRNGVVSGLVLDDQTVVSLNALENGRLLNGPGTDVSPFFLAVLDVLLSGRWLPPRFPVVGELFQEGSFQGSGLRARELVNQLNTLQGVRQLTVKVGLTSFVEVEDSAADEEASSSARTTAARSAVAPTAKRMVNEVA